VIRSICFFLTVLVSGYSTFLGAYESNDAPFNALEDEIQWLQEEVFVTTATKTKEVIGKSGSTLSVITHEDLRDMGARTLMDALKRMPGLGVSQINAGLTSLEVRGVKTDFAEKVLFLINGHPINNNLVNGGANSSYHEFIVDDIQRVEIVRGPGSALYGANAFVAVVNIVTKTAKDVRGIEVTAGVGSFGTSKFNIQTGYLNNDYSFSANLNISETDGLDGFIESDAIGQAGNVDYSQKRYEAGFNLMKGSFFLQGRYVYREAGNFLSINNVLNDESDQEYIDYFIEAGIQKKLSHKASLNTKFYFDHFEFDNTWDLYPEGYSDPANTSCPSFGSCPDGYTIRSPVEHDILGTDSQFTYQLTQSQKLLVGLMFEHQSQYGVELWTNSGVGELQDISSVANWNASQNRDVTAFYVQDIWDIQDSLRLIAGARYDHYSDFGETVNPRASLTWSFIPSSRLLISYGSAFRAPTFGELFNSNNAGIIGDTDLDPEEIETYEIGVQGKVSRRVDYTITWFRNEIENLIAPVEGAAVNTAANVGELEVEGVELEVSSRLSNGSTLGANYTYQHSINEVTGDRLSDIPLHRVNLTFNYFISRYLSLFTGVMFKGETVRDSGDTRDDVDAYTTVDIALVSRDLWLKNLELKASAYNLFDKTYYDPAPNVMLSDYPKAGRNFMLEAVYKL